MDYDTTVSMVSSDQNFTMTENNNDLGMNDLVTHGLKAGKSFSCIHDRLEWFLIIVKLFLGQARQPLLNHLEIMAILNSEEKEWVAPHYRIDHAELSLEKKMMVTVRSD